MKFPFRQLLSSGIFFALAGTFLFSLKPIVIKEAYRFDVDSVQILTLRMLFAMPFYLFVAWQIWHKNSTQHQQYRSYLPRVMLLGFLGYYFASLLDMEGLQYISAQLERIVLFCFPTLVVLFSKWWLKTEVPKNIWWVIGISYGGILVIFGHDLVTLGADVVLGTSLVFISAVAFAIYVTFSKGIIQVMGSRLFTALAMLSASAFISCHFLITKPLSDLIVPIEVYYRVLILAFFCTVVPSFLIAAAVGKMGPERTSVVGTIGPVFTSVLAVFG